eukprot:1215919-Lingulodinium_polyedra.AAC.1
MHVTSVAARGQWPPFSDAPRPWTARGPPLVSSPTAVDNRSAWLTVDIIASCCAHVTNCTSLIARGFTTPQTS